MRLLICAGGTGGGVYPALAVLQALTNDEGRRTKEGSLSSSEIDRKRSTLVIRPSSVLWVGTEGGMEADLVKRAGIPFETIPAAGVHGVGWRALPRNVWAVSLTSFLTDISSEMVINILPLFLANVLGVRTSVIGVIEGVAEATASLLKVFSGWLSDRLRARKWLAVAGHGQPLARPQPVRQPPRKDL